MRSSRGFTLLEVLLVAAIVGLSAAVIMYSVVTSQPQQAAQNEVRRLAAVLTLAQEEAELVGNDLGLVVGEDGYQWVIADDGGLWHAINDDEALAARTWPEEVRAELELDDLPWQQEDRLTESGSLFEDTPFFEEEEEKQELAPQILIGPGGDVTPFSLTVTHTGLELVWRIDVNDIGEVTVVEPQDEDQG